MEQDIFFMPLGGGQRVGASSYYLRIADTNIILDAGMGRENGMEFEPDFYSLVTSPFIQSLNQINQIFISHAHFDHVGYLLKLMKQTNRACVYMTEITRILTEFQLYDKLYMDGNNRQEEARLAAKSLLEKVARVTFLQSMDFGKYRVSFYPAGHIPGAMMVLFDTGRRKILYTGDYSLQDTLLTDGCMIPGDIEIDMVIMCGLHAKHPGYVNRTDALLKKADDVLRNIMYSGQSVRCHIPQLSKGVEFLEALNKKNQSGVPVYVDDSVMKVVLKMERLSIPLLNQHNRVMGEIVPEEPHIYVTSRHRNNRSGVYHDISVDFSLHEDFDGMKRFLKMLNPRQAVVVHCAKEEQLYDRTIEQEIMADSDCRTQFIFAEEKEMYKI